MEKQRGVSQPVTIGQQYQRQVAKESLEQSPGA